MINLKKKISICLFLILLAVCGTGFRVYLDNRSLPADPIVSSDTKDSEETAESMHVADAGKYYLILEGDSIFVYASDKETLCYEIPVRNRPLPEEWRRQLSEGISFSTDEELYEFLENYSS